MSKIKYIQCDICGKMIDEDITEKVMKFFAGIIHKRNIDICKSCLHKIDRVSEDLLTEEKLIEYVLKSERSKEFKENSDLYSAYLSGVEESVKYLSQHQITRK